MYTDFLKLCGYEDDELKKEMPRIEKAFDKLGIGKEDIVRAEERVQENFDTSLKGIVKSLRVWMEELVSLALCRDEYKKVIYSDWPLPGAMMMAVRHLSDDLYTTSIAEVLNVTMGQIFDKLGPILEAGEHAGLGVGSAHCALWQTHIGAIKMGIIPRPDLIVSPGWYCDQATEADQLLAELYDIPVVYLDGVVDAGWGEWPDNLSERRIRYAGSQLNKVLKKIEEVTGCTFTEEVRKAGVKENAVFYTNFNNLVEMVGRSDPQVISQTNLNLLYWMSNTPMRKKDEGIKAITTLIIETKERIDRGEGVVEKGAPKVYFGIRQAVDPSVLKMVESLGLSIAVCQIDWLTHKERTKTKSTEYGQKMMEGFFKRGLLYSCQGGIDYFTEYCREWNVDGFIISYPYSCRPWAITPIMSKKSITEDLGIPCLVLEGDCYDTRNYSAGQSRTRVETFAELLKMRKAS
ncbi:MAG: 2-hydroxyacyl-CoA dehydratase family protein [Thermodesulfobacteriota bacterium]